MSFRKPPHGFKSPSSDAVPKLLTSTCQRAAMFGSKGPLTLNQWTDREGAARVNLEVRASDIKFLSSSTEKATAAAAAAEVSSEDDVSF